MEQTPHESLPSPPEFPLGGDSELPSVEASLLDGQSASIQEDALGRELRLRSLCEKARALPETPGVYLMKDTLGRVLYVGKALRLCDRVSSYFIPSTDLGARKQPMLDRVVDFDIVPCESEWEALFVEARLVKDIHPPFNVALQDDKTFPYLAVTTREDFPTVMITRHPTDPRLKGARLFGPFLHGPSLRHAVEHLQSVFRFRTCDLAILDGDPTLPRFRPCLLHAIGKCTAPCAAKISKTEYREDVDRFLRFFVSKRTVMTRELEAEMAQASSVMSFERAAVLRDQLKALARLDHRETRSDDSDFNWQPEVTQFIQDPMAGVRSLQRALGIETPLRCMEAIDIAHLQGGETVGSKVAFIDGRPFKDGYRRFRVRSVSNDDYSAIREVVSRRYRDAGEGQELYPDLILIDGGIGQLNAAMEAFQGLRVQPPFVISLAKKEELLYRMGSSEPLKLGREHPGLKLCQAIRDEAHRFAQHYHHRLRERALLGERKKKPKGTR